MAIKFNRSQTFATNGTVTAAGLHNLIDGTDIYQALITDQTTLNSVGTGDFLLIADADLSSGDAPRKTTVLNLFEDALTLGTYADINLTGNLTYGTATGNRTVSTTASITTGTINNATLGTTTGTAATFTTGTLTTGVIPTGTFGTTASTAATITSGTVTNLNSTSGTITTLNSTTGTITNLSTTLAGDFTISQGTGTIGTGITNRLVPVGSVIAFAVNSAPTGWLGADGSAVNRTTYASLFSTIGTTHGTGDGSTTFNLPDLRGIFVRGSGSQTISGTTYSGTFAERQQDDFKSHTHTFNDTGVSQTGLTGGPTPFLNAGTTAKTTGSTGGTETRPANIALLYCIKF